MVLWIAMAALAAAVCLPMLLALRRAPTAGARRAAVDIYRDQLNELGRDVDRGLIQSDEAEAARTEISRRLIRADAALQTASSAPKGGLRNAAAIVVVLMPLAAVALYVGLGSPGLPDRPLVARVTAPPEQQDVAALVARVEQQLVAHPEDGRGWDLLAPVYVALGRLDDAVVAYRNAIRLLGSTADRQVNLGLALVTLNNGVTADAVAAFRQAAQMAPGDIRARLYLARALEDQGKVAEAAAVWREFLANTPADAPGVKEVQAELARLEASAPGGPGAGQAGARPGGPSAADVAAALELPAEQRTAMIEGMVATLASRLETNSGDAQGWAQLVRSYAVLGRADDARAALVKAKAALGADKDKTAIVEEAARSAGIAP
jgi:cytochrome c-type biogenesis protein CcmH